MFKYAVLYLLILIGVFFEPDFLGSAGNVILKILVLGGISYFLYALWKDDDETPLNAINDQENAGSLSTNSNESQEFFQTIFDNEAVQFTRLLQDHSQYKDYLRNQFTLIWDFVLPHNGYLIHLNSNRHAYLLHKQTKMEMQGPFNFSQSQIFSLVDKNNHFLVENNLEPETKLLPFYEETDFKPAACLAFSTVLPAGDKLYWIFDAASADFFNDNDFDTLKRIDESTLQTLTGGLKNQILENRFTEEQIKFDLADKLNLSQSLERSISTFTQFLVDKFEASKLTIALRTSHTEAVIQKTIGIDDSFKEGYAFPLDEGLNGWVIMKNNAYLIDNIDKGEYFIPRFSRSEKTNYELRSFLSTPISLDGKALGMITLEDKTENKYNDEDKDRLMLYSAILAKAVGRFQNATQGE